MVDANYNNEEIELVVNETEIGLNKFATRFLKGTLTGMIKSLETKNISTIETAIIDIAKINPNNINTAEISLTVNETPIKINDFVSGIMKESIYGMIKALNTEKFGVKKIETINIKIKK